jgi:hypothetical protein
MCEEHFIGMQRVSVTIDHEIHRGSWVGRGPWEYD